MAAKRRQSPVERLVRVSGRIALSVDRDACRNRRIRIARLPNVTDGRRARGEIHHNRVSACARKREGNRIRAHYWINAPRNMYAHRMRIREGHTDQAGLRYPFDIIAKAEDVTAANQCHRGDPRDFCFFDRKVGGHQAGDMTGTTVAVDTGGARRFVCDARVGAPIEPLGAKIRNGRIDVIGALDVVSMQVSVDHALRT